MKHKLSRSRFSLTTAVALVGTMLVFFLQSDSFSPFGAATPDPTESLNASSAQNKQAPNPPKAEGQAVRAPDFSLLDSKGRAVRLSTLRGKVVVINFWATWCGPCRAEIPGFLEVYNKYKSKGLEIIGISLDDDGWESVAPFVKRFKIDYPVVLGDRDVVLNYGGITAIPTTFVVDRKGYVVSGRMGYFSKEHFAREIEKFF